MSDLRSDVVRQLARLGRADVSDLSTRIYMSGAESIADVRSAIQRILDDLVREGRVGTIQEPGLGETVYELR